jgi:hypothetical protein
MGLNTGAPSSPGFVRYGNFTGLNTRKDPHTLDRSELAASVNLWSAYDGALAKRPGSVAFTGAGPTGAGSGGLGMVAGRFGDLTYLVVLQVLAGVPTLYAAAAGGAWTVIGTLSAGVTTIDAAQMYDPETGKDTLFIVDGVDIPQAWQGPGTMIAPVKTGIQNGNAVIGTNPALAGGGNLIAAAIGSGASATTILTVTVNATGTGATVTDSSGQSINIVAGGTGTIDGVPVTLGNYAAGDANKTGSITVTQGDVYLPKKANNIDYITPKYVATLGNNSHLFYSGEASAPSAVYISNPFFPQRFESAAQQVNPYSGTYLPAIIGLNDGVDGGAITGLESLQGAMIVFKESAVYSMVLTVLLGDVPVWQVLQIASDGALSPRSITPFEIQGISFIAYLSIDGIYITDGQSSQKQTGAVPTIFDASLTGGPALITDRTTAIGVRHGNRLILSFATSGVGYNQGMVWLDFDNRDAKGLPLVGQMQGWRPGGMVSLRGPHDDGNIAWINAQADYVGKFGVGFADGLDGNGNPISIQVTLAGKADIFEDVFGEDAMLKRKVAKALYLLVSMPSQNALSGIAFQPTVITDALQQFGPGSTVQPIYAPPAGAWGANWGNFLWSQGGAQYFVVKVPMQAAVRGRVLQVAIQESSALPWVLVGYILELNDQLVDV